MNAAFVCDISKEELIRSLEVLVETYDKGWTEDDVIKLRRLADLIDAKVSKENPKS